MKKVRKRLKPNEAKSIGITPKNNEVYDLKKSPRYTITLLQWYKVKELRNKVKEAPKTAKILIFDIETAPNKAYVWGKWKQNINDCQLINDWFCLTWSAKWLFDDYVLNDRLTPKEAIEQNDRRIMLSIWSLLDEADIIIGHNIKRFDVKKLNTRFLAHGLNSPSSFLMIDTLHHARKQFSFHSNKLDFIAQKLGVGKKVQHEGFDMWVKCMEGDKEALKQMQIYNDGDILINEEVYLKLRPFIMPHPNISLFLDTDKLVCPSCESEKIKPISDYSTYANIYTEYRCDNCGNRCRSNKKETKITPLPR